MQILGKRSKVLLIAVSIAILVALGVSFAVWDNMSTVSASTGNIAYSTAQVGDVITFGNYYQTGVIVDGEYEKTAIEWLVVDKDERTGQLTLMSKLILAAGSYFGNYYKNSADKWGYHYNPGLEEVDKIQYNQAYVESTARAFLNNLERRDLGGDLFDGTNYMMSVLASDKSTGKLLTSVGFSNKNYNFGTYGVDYKRPIYTSGGYNSRPAARGFYDEAFTDDEKAMIAPKVIPGHVGHRWPNNTNNPENMSYIESSIDKVWLPSVTELNAMKANDYEHINPSDASSSTVFKYFKDYAQYKNPLTGANNLTLAEALKTERTPFVKDNSFAMNYSIPIYNYQSTGVNLDIHKTGNSIDYYWTRSPLSYNRNHVRLVSSSGAFSNDSTVHSEIGVRPCIILKY